MTKTNTARRIAPLTDKQLAAMAQTAIDTGAVKVKRADETTKQEEQQVKLVPQQPLAPTTAAIELIERQEEDANSVAAHMQRLNGGVSVAEFEKALHTVASFIALPVKRIDPRTGEILTFEMARGEIEQLLNSVCYSAAKLLNPLDDYSSVAKAEKARQRVLRDQQTLSEGNEIDAVEARRNMDSCDFRNVIVEAVSEVQEVAERVYKVRTGKEFKRPAFQVKAKTAKVTDQDERNKLLAEMAARTGKTAVRIEGDKQFNMATDSVVRDAE